jgi:hypothetical protein
MTSKSSKDKRKDEGRRGKNEGSKIELLGEGKKL